MHEFIAKFESLQKERHQSEQDQFWKNHPRFQIPHRVLALKGKAEAQVLLYLYERAEGVSFYCATEIVLEIKVTLETLCARTGLGNQAVSQAIKNLDNEYIKVVRRRDRKGRVRVSVYLLLHSQSKEPMTATPKTYGVCRTNLEQFYITIPKDTRKVLNSMTPTGRQVCLSALAVASRKMLTSFSVAKDLLMAESGLKKRMFERGFAECRENGLLTYSRYVLTLNDPKTKKPSERWKRGDCFIEHENTKWRFDLNSVSPQHWQYAVEKLLKTQFVLGSDDNWSKTTRGNLCPFCKQHSSFSVCFKTGNFRCHSDECGEFGRLGTLLQRILGVKKMHPVLTYVQTCIAELDTVKAASA